MRTIFVQLAGVYCFGFVVFHLFFWKIFRWKQDLHRLTPVNRAIMQVLNIQLTYIFLIVGAMTFLFTEQLLSSDLGTFVLGAASAFWFMRCVEQLIFFDRKNRTSIAFFLIFAVGGMLFLLPLLME